MKNVGIIKKNNPLRKHQVALGLFIGFAIGSYIRIFQWMQQRSLFIDEANLARNIYEKSFADLFGVLDYEQYAPPLFTQLTKALCEVFGYNELSFRSLPLLASIASLLVLKSIIQRGKLKTGFLVVFFCAFSPMLLRYGTELKQYSLDFLIPLVLCYLIYFKKNSTSLWSIATVGLVSIFFSMPAALILAAIGIERMFRPQNERAIQYKWVLISSLWFLGFIFLYFSSLQANIGSEYLESAHFRYFPSLDMSNNLNILKEWIGHMVGFKTVHFLFFAIFFTLGLVELYKKQKEFLITIILSIIVLVFVSILHQYTMRPRLLIFTFGLLWIVIAYGLESALRMHKIVAGILFSFAVFTLSLSIDFSLFYKEITFTDYKEEMTILNETDLDVIQVNFSAFPSYYYYKNIRTGLYPALPDARLVSSSDLRIGINSSHLLMGPSWQEEERKWSSILSLYSIDTLCDGNTRLFKLKKD